MVGRRSWRRKRCGKLLRTFYENARCVILTVAGMQENGVAVHGKLQRFVGCAARQRSIPTKLDLRDDACHVDFVMQHTFNAAPYSQRRAESL